MSLTYTPLKPKSRQYKSNRAPSRVTNVTVDLELNLLEECLKNPKLVVVQDAILDTYSVVYPLAKQLYLKWARQIGTTAKKKSKKRKK